MLSDMLSAVRKAEAEAAELIKSAETEAEEIRVSAKRKADEMRTDAAADADKRIADAATAVRFEEEKADKAAEVEALAYAGKLEKAAAESAEPFKNEMARVLFGR